VRLFTDVIRDVHSGSLVEQASLALAELTQAVMDTGKGGKLKIELSVKPQGKGSNVMIISGKVKSDCPTNDVNPAIFFANLEGDLLREDPTMFRAFADAKPAKKEA
jgi:hypothetical protein